MTSFKLRATVAAVAGIALFGLAAGAKADSTDDLLKKLRDKGVLSEQEYDEFNSTRDTEKAKKSSEIKASFKDGISWESGDKQHKFSVNGRVQLDYRSFSEENATGTQTDTFDIRRAYLTAKGTFYNTYDFEVTYNGANAGGSDLLYAWMNARYWEGLQFQFGQFKQPMSMEELGSSRFINFTERSFVTQLVPAVDRGIQIHGTPVKGLNYAVGVFNGVNVNGGQTANDTSTLTDGKAVTGRITTNIADFMDIKDAVYHLGASYSRSNDNLGGSALSMRSEGRGTNIMTTGVLVTDYDLVRKGLEGAVAYGPVKLQAEYLKATFEPGSGATQVSTGGTTGDKDIKAWYASVNWLITGENYASTYKGGKFGERIKPLNEFITPGAPGFGAWDVGVRYSKFDASDFTATDTTDVFNATGENGEFNEAHAWTVGLKWIPNPNVRYVLDYVKTDMECVDNVANRCTNDQEKAINFRAQFDF